MQIGQAASSQRYFTVRAPAPATLKALQKSGFLPPYGGADTRDENPASAPAGGFVLNLQRREPARSELSLDGRAMPVVPFPQGTMCLVSLIIDPAAWDTQGNDHVTLYVRRATFDRLADALGAARIKQLPLAAGAAADDILMAQLGACLLPAIERPDQMDDLVVDQIAGAVHTHLAQRFGALSCPHTAGKGSLAPWQLRLAQKMLSENLDSGSVLDRIAQDCRLSVSHFTRAFTRSTGMPPHRWLTRRRIEKATDLLRSSTLTLSDIGLACGFFDQSHFSRVFSQSVGMAPGEWRRSNQGEPKGHKRN